MAIEHLHLSGVCSGMPCYSPDARDLYNESERIAQQLSFNSEIRRLNEIVKQLSMKVDHTTQLLCSVCKKTDDEVIARIDGLSQWWADHKRFDSQK